ncbi:hypothetical protein CsatB_023264 [Cannabis sativa]
MQMGTTSTSTSSSPNPKFRYYTFTSLAFLFFFLLSILLFTKRTLDPAVSISLYRDFFSQTPSSSSSSNLSLPIQEPISPNSEPDPLDIEIDPKIINDELSDKNDPGSPPVNGVSEETSPKLIKNDLSDIKDGYPVPANLVSDEIDAKVSNGEVSNKNEEVPVYKKRVSDDFGAKIINGELSDKNGSDPPRSFERTENKCDLYSGTWVKDEEYPIYRPGSCPYVDEAFDCQTNGRRDSEYLKWRWKPHACDLPRFNATDFLVRISGKKLMLVGDSVNRNQFESILCLLREGLQNKSRMYEVNGHKITKGRGYYVFKFEDYNCTVDFVRSHFLVREGVRMNGQGSSNPTLSIDRIDKSASRWKRADILVFNTGHWWTHGKTARGKNYYREGDFVYPQFDAVEAYRRSMKTWAKWIDKNVKPEKQMVFYRGYSTAHFRGGDWDSGGSCNGETKPAFSGAILENYPLKMKITEEVIKDMRVPVKLLNVTSLTNFRKDGHPSIYGKNSTAGKKVSRRKQDCSHWCLPGVPDAWNELIYASLVFHQTNSVSNT